MGVPSEKVESALRDADASLKYAADRESDPERAARITAAYRIVRELRDGEGATWATRL